MGKAIGYNPESHGFEFSLNLTLIDQLGELEVAYLLEQANVVRHNAGHITSLYTIACETDMP